MGNSLSGQDISMEIVKVAKEVYLSAKSLDVTQGLSKVISKHRNLHLYPQVCVLAFLDRIDSIKDSWSFGLVWVGLQIQSLHEDGRVEFEDGSCVIADTIIYCTG